MAIFHQIMIFLLGITVVSFPCFAVLITCPDLSSNKAWEVPSDLAGHNFKIDSNGTNLSTNVQPKPVLLEHKAKQTWTIICSYTFKVGAIMELNKAEYSCVQGSDAVECVKKQK